MGFIKARVSLEIRDSPAFVAKGSKDQSSFIKEIGLLTNRLPVAENDSSFIPLSYTFLFKQSILFG